MPVVYERCTDDVKEVGHDLINRFHPDLREKGTRVQIEYVFAEMEPDSNGDRPTGDAVKLHGRPCYAVVKIISAKDRALGGLDARVTIDKAKWGEMSASERRALIDHELLHLTAVRDDAGFMKMDAYERPKLRMRHHDWDLGWFDEIAKRHGPHSIEVQQARKLADEGRTIYFQASFEFFQAAA